MSKWPTRQLSELCSIEGGDAAPQGEQYFQNGITPFVRMKDLGRYHFTRHLAETDDKLTDAAIREHGMKIFEPGCILFPRSGSVALNHRAVLGVRAAIVSHIGIIKVAKPELRTDFLYWFLTAFDMTNLSNKTTGVDSIAFAEVKRIEIPVPPLAEQERIVRILDEAESLSSLRTEADQRCSTISEVLFGELFGNPIQNDRNWPLAEVYSLGKVVTGTTPPSVLDGMFGGTIPFVTPGDLERDTLSPARFVTEAGASQSRTVRPGSTLVCCIGATIGKTDRTWVHSAFNQQINAVEWNDSVDDDYGCMCMRLIKPVIVQHGGLTALPILKKSLFERLQIPVPPIALQRTFAARAVEVRALQAAQASSRVRLDDLFQSLLHRAFQGEL